MGTLTSNKATKYIAGGGWVQVHINSEIVGLATNVTYDEDFGIQPANVLNFLGPIDYDSQGYTCNITIGTFVPEAPGTVPDSAGQGTTCIFDITDIITRKTIQDSDGKPGEFTSLAFYSTSKGKNLATFERVILASNGIQVAPNSYVTANMRFMAIARTVNATATNA